MTKQQDDHDYIIIDNMYLYAKDPYEVKYHYLIKNAKIMILKISKIQRPLLNIRKICKMLLKILKSTTQVENALY